MQIIKNCLHCSTKFKTILSDLMRGHGKYCSRKCYDLYRTGKKIIPKISAIQRFFLSISFDDHSRGCWIWERLRNRAGYGRFIEKKKETVAHRISWKLFYGDIPLGYIICHKCDNPSCVNPDHLFIGNYKDNAQDRSKKGRNRDQRGIKHNMAKLTNENVFDIKKDLASGMKQYLIAEKYHVSPMIISNIKNGKIWNHL